MLSCGHRCGQRPEGGRFRPVPSRLLPADKELCRAGDIGASLGASAGPSLQDTVLRSQVVCSPGGLCPALIACFCTHGSGRVEQGASRAVLCWETLSAFVTHSC